MNLWQSHRTLSMFILVKPLSHIKSLPPVFPEIWKFAIKTSDFHNTGNNYSLLFDTNLTHKYKIRGKIELSVLL